MRFAELEAVTVDGYGTLLQLIDPVPVLRRALASRGVDRSDAEIGRAFRAEVSYYRPHALEGRDAATLAALRRDCVEVFLAALDEPLAPEEFVDDFIAALVFEPVPGAPEAIAAARPHELGRRRASSFGASSRPIASSSTKTTP